MPGDTTREPTDLDPKTLEIWAGIRSVSSRASSVQDEVDDLRAQLSGFKAYKKFLRSQDGFDSLEDNLTSRAESIAEITADDVEATVTLLEDNFTDFDTYRGDSNNGTLSQGTYDAYRTFLTNNGIGTVDADEHIQLLKTAFDPDASFDSDASEHEDWDDLETELENNGVASSTAADVVADLKSVFDAVAAFDRLVASSDTWGEVETGLVNRGLTSTEASDAVAAFKTAYGNTLGSAQRDNFSAFDSFAEFETYLTNIGLTSEEAATLRQKVESEYADFEAFRQQVLAREGALATLLASVRQADTTGDSAAGLRVFDEPGTTVSGVDVPAGAVSLRGAEIHFEQVSPTQTIDDGGQIEYSNLQLADNLITTNETTTAQVEINNISSDEATVTVPLSANGSVIARRTITIGANSGLELRFEIDGGSLGVNGYQIRIGDAGPVELAVSPIGL